MYPPVTAMSRPETERMLGPHPRPYHCGRAEEGFWRVQKSQGTNTWLVRSSTDWPPVCWSLMSPIQANTPTYGHWWPPTLRQATALKPCPLHPPLGAPEGTGTPNGLSPFLGVQAWWGGSEGQDSWTPSPSAPGHASLHCLKRSPLKNAKAGLPGLGASSAAPVAPGAPARGAPHRPRLSRFSYTPTGVSVVAAGARDGAGSGPRSAGTAPTFW